MIGSFAIIILIATLMICGASVYWHSRQKQFLLSRVTIDHEYRKKAATLLKKLGVEGQVAVGVTIFDVLYNSLKIDPFVLRGIDHLHHSQNFDSLGELMSYMKESIVKDGDGSAFRQIIHKYKGYTGEEYAFDSLRSSGAHVEVPQSGTFPGIDAYIDGNPINIKITDNPAYISTHLREHPDVSVYTNAEMHQAFSDHHNVIIDHDLSAQDMFHTTGDSISGMVDMGDLIDKIPLITLTITTIKNTKQVFNGKKDIKTAGEHAVCDTAAVGIGGWAGGKIGLMIGLALVPATGGTSAIIVPFVSSFIGSVMGILSGKTIMNWFKERHLRAAIDQLKNSAAKYCEVFFSSANNIVQKLVRPYDQQIDFCNNELKNGKWWPLRVLFPSLKEKFYDMSADSISKEVKEIRAYYQELLRLLREKKSDEAGLLLYAQGTSVVAGDHALLCYYRSVEQAIKKVEQEKTKLC